MIHCPFPFKDYPHITSGHGAGGGLTETLINGIFRPAFRGTAPLEGTLDSTLVHDSAVRVGPKTMAVSTDVFVIHPLFFPGGDIGKLSVIGTANDLAMSGARPLYMTLGFVLEEGLPTEILAQIAQSAGQTARELGIEIICGDTKVVERGKADGLYICSTGIGEVMSEQLIHPKSLATDDVILLSGDIGRHGTAVMAHRHQLVLGFPLESDCASLAAPVLELRKRGIQIHCLRDLTRGGLATAMAEIAEQSGFDLMVQENSVPIHETVQGASELLGIDPLYIANEGRFVLFLPEDQASDAIVILKKFAVSTGTVRIGKVAKVAKHKPKVYATNAYGTGRIWDKMAGNPLPRIC